MKLSHGDDGWSQEELREIERIGRLGSDPSEQQQTFNAGAGNRSFNISIAVRLIEAQRSLRLIPDTYRALIREAIENINRTKREIESLNAAQLKQFPAKKRQLKKAMVEFENWLFDWHNARKKLESHLHAMDALPPDERETAMKAWWDNIIWPQVLAFGRMPSNQSGLPDWQASSNPLTTVTSEQSVLKLGRALGQMRSGPESDHPLLDNPHKDISGNLGGVDITAHAELRVRAAGDDSPLALIAERLSDPSIGLDINARKCFWGLENAYRTRLQTDGRANITIDELADFMGFQRVADGRHHNDAHISVREALKVWNRIGIEALIPRPIKGHKLPTKLSEHAFSFTFFRPTTATTAAELAADRRAEEDHWMAITFLPNQFLSVAFSPKSQQFMGIDKTLHNLHPVRERRENLLAFYLQELWRINSTDFCKVRIRFGNILISGMGYTEDEIQAPSRGRELMARMETALDKLEEKGAVKHWQGDATWAETRDMLEAAPGKRRLTREPWRKLLREAIITIEAGPAYYDRYKNRGIEDKADSLLAEFRAYCGRRGSNDLVAYDLGIGTVIFAEILTGERAISATLAERMRRLLASEAEAHETLPLPFDSPTPSG